LLGGRRKILEKEFFYNRIRISTKKKKKNEASLKIRVHIFLLGYHLSIGGG